MFSFLPLSRFPEGLLYDLLVQSYQGLNHNFNAKWKRFDHEAFTDEKVGRCVYISCLNDKPTGFFSYDPRLKPTAIIGHHCVLPQYRRLGYGTQQINKLLEILKFQGFTKVRVTTGDHPFFIPAQKMYLSLGFKEMKRYKKEGHGYKVIDYEITF